MQSNGRAPVLRVVLIKPSKYGADGYVQRFRRGFMPNATLPHMVGLTPDEVAGHRVEVHAIDEYVECQLGYLRLLEADRDCRTLVALVGVQTPQFHRALDLAAYARAHGVRHVVIGGPHPMTADSTPMQGRGVSVATVEAELIWKGILEDAVAGELRPVYSADTPWQEVLDPPALQPPPRHMLRRYAVPMLGVYPARGCPYRCNFCMVFHIAGRKIRSQPIDTTLATLRAAKAGGVVLVMITTDNFNKYPEAEALLEAIIEERLGLRFFVQCDTQVIRQPRLVELLSRAGCYQMFVGVESFDRATLLAAKKNHNHPERYAELVKLCHEHKIGAHFSNIIGFPTDTEATVLEHLRVLREIGPDVASFYILTPSGEQGREFMQQGLITEPNLDRYDGTCVTWRHPHIGSERLVDLLYHCYGEFYKDVVLPAGKISDLLARWRDWSSPEAMVRSGTECYAVLSRVAVMTRRHPMDGGFFPVTRDHVNDYLDLRRTWYGFDLAPLPTAGTHPQFQKELAPLSA